MSTKRCNHCDETKDIEMFVKDHNQKDGYRKLCKKCHCKINKKYRTKNIEKVREQVRKSTQKIREKKKTDIEYKIHSWCVAWRNRQTGKEHKKSFKKRVLERKNIELNILKDIVKEGFINFPYMEIQNKEKYKCLSIDRINPKIGYTNENIRAVPFWINSAKLDLEENKFKELLYDYYCKTYKKDEEIEYYI